MLKIGLTGPSGAGKGLVCSVLERTYGIPSIDADRVYHGLLIPPSDCLSALSEAFGREILNGDGTLHRAALAAVVFSCPDAELRSERIARLNAITHPHVLKKMREIAEAYRQSGTAAVILDAPALYESGLSEECDLTVAVTARPETRLLRIMERDGIPMERARARIRAQGSDAFYTERADAVLHNDGTADEFERQILAFYNEHIAPRIPSA